MASVFLATISLDGMAGGLEKNIILLSNHLAEIGQDVHLVTFDRKDAESFYPRREEVRWHRIGISQPHLSIGFWDRWILIQRIRTLLKAAQVKERGRPVLICFHHGILLRFFLGAAFTGTRIICSERNSLSLYDYFSRPKWNLNFFLLSFVKKIVVQFAEYRKDYPFWMRGRILHIPNPILPEEEQAQPDRPNDKGRFTLLNVGRLSAQKQQGLLIRAFGRIAGHCPQWDLAIIGDGGLQSFLEELIAREGLEERVSLVGKSDRVKEWMLRSHLFCLPSQWEGFPNALGEALAFGLPAVGFAECEGVNKLIIDGTNGVLAPGQANEDTLARALQTLMRDAEMRRRMGGHAHTSAQQYQPKRVFSAWEELIDDVSHI